MKLLLEVDLEDRSCKIIKVFQLTKRDIVELICSYFNTTITELRKHPLKRRDEYVSCRKFICYFLDKKLQIHPYEIGRILRYSVKEDNVSIVSKNIADIEDGIQLQDNQIIRSFNNITRLLDGLMIK